MATYGLTKTQRKNYYSLATTPVPSSVIDFVQLFVYNLNTNQLLKNTTIPISELLNDSYEEEPGVLKLNIGQHLRNLGYSFINCRVEYKFFKRVAGNLQQFYLYEISTNELYSQELPFGTKEINGELRYFVADEDGELDLDRELQFVKSGYNINDISPDRTELIIGTNEQLPYQIESALNFQLDTIDRAIVNVPLRSDYEVLQSAKFKFDTPDVEPNLQNYILELPENDSNGFDISMIGKRIVFESFFEAQIPTHYRGQYLPSKKLTYAESNGMAPDTNIFIRPNEYRSEERKNQAQDGEIVTIPYFKDDKDFTVTNNNTFRGDKISPEGLFIKRLLKDFGTTNISYLPRDIWQTEDLGPRTGGKINFENAGTFPYRYNRALDEDNIDFRGRLVKGGGLNLEGSALLSDFRGGYKRGKNLDIVYLDWNAKITKVFSKNRIQVSSNLQEVYYNLREQGFKITKIGEVEYNRPKLVEALPFGIMSSKQFYIDDETNDIQEYRTYLRANNDSYLITNRKKVSTGTALKLQQPLRDDVISYDNERFTNVDIVEEVLNSYEDRISLIPKQKVTDTFLLPANFDGETIEINKRPTEFKSHDTLLGSENEHNRQLERLLISGSLLDVQPNIDYQKTTTDLSSELDDTGFGNFVHFSNAESRLRNFRKKLILIEDYTTESASLATITSAESTIQKVEKKRQRVIDSFSPYEDYLYFESSSYQSSSNGQFHDTSWPKTNSSKPYTLATTGSAVGISWYNNMISSASSYDFNNQDSLRNTLPEHVNQDPSNNVFLEFMDMVGEQFDETWTYIKSLTDVNIRVNNISEGISKDVAKHYSEALGVKLFSGNDLVDLSEYLLGKNTDGTDKNESSGEALTEEIWKRILANLPFFIKTKGTERALKGIMNCYGIPSTVLRVREFGGPDKGTRVSYELKRKFTHALDFRAGQYIKTPWKPQNDLYPNSIEFRFKANSGSADSGSMVLVQKSGSKEQGSWAISLQDNGKDDDFGHLNFSISGSGGSNVQYITSSLQQFYNDEMWSVMLTRKSSSGVEHATENIAFTSSYELTTKQYDSTRQRIIYQDSESLETNNEPELNAAFTSSGDVFIGGVGNLFGSQLSGSLMEYRLWTEALSQSVFDNHVRVPKAYNGNYTSSAYDNLLFRLPLDDNTNLQTSPTASAVQHLIDYSGAISGSNINGFTGNFFTNLTDQEKIKIPNIGNRRNATKIRIENNSLPLNANLSPDVKQEVSSQDFAPIDSNKLGVYFSPTDVINEDIIYTFADFNFDDQVGDPRDEFEHNYRGLRSIKYDYFKRYRGGHNNFFDYLRILDFYDDSVFEVLKQFLPARANSDLGNLIEPNILERNKQKNRDKIEITQPYYENAGDLEVGIQVSRFISGSKDNVIEIGGESLQKNSVIAYATGSLYRGTSSPTLVHLNEINPRDPDTTTYATASVTRGGTSVEFLESVQPFISSSRLSRFNLEKEFFYGSLSDSTSAGFGETYRIPSFIDRGELYVISQSFKRSEHESLFVDTILERTFYTGTQLNKNNDPSGEEPVQITFTNPTKLVTQTPGESRLKTE